MESKNNVVAIVTICISIFAFIIIASANICDFMVSYYEDYNRWTDEIEIIIKSDYNFGYSLNYISFVSLPMSIIMQIDVFIRRKRMDNSSDFPTALKSEVSPKLKIAKIISVISIVLSSIFILISASNSGSTYIDNTRSLIIMAGVNGLFFVFLTCMSFLWITLPDISQKRVQAFEENQKRLQEETEKHNILEAEFREKCKKLNIPSKAAYVVLQEGSENILRYTSYKIWSDNNFLYFFYDRYLSLYIDNPNIKIDVEKIPMKNIIEYHIEGETWRETKISGGNINVKGAIKGGILAGDAGMILGGKTPVTSREIEHDTRKTVLVVKHNNKKHRLVFTPRVFEILKDVIPDKDFAVVTEVEKARAIAQQVKPNTVQSSDAADSLRKLKAMKDEGLISDEEFSAKKEEILARM